MTRPEAQNAADMMIGAAEALDKVARELKRQAKIIRSGDSSAMTCAFDLWMMHKASDVRYASERALAEMLNAN